MTIVVDKKICSSIPLVYFNIRLTVLRLGRDDYRDIEVLIPRRQKKEYLREGSVRNIRERKINILKKATKPFTLKVKSSLQLWTSTV
jgi:hypothetical protein